MKNNVSLDHLAKRELDAIKAIDLRKLLLNNLKNEAYDDAALDNMWVANVEKEVPGIITAYSGDHNFATSSPEENHRVIMEALDSGTAIKAGIIGAIILLIYKVYRVMTNNSAFSGGGGGGRGSATHNSQKNEELRDAGKRASDVLNEVKEKANVAAKNKLNLEDDSPAYKGITKFIHTVNPQDAEKLGVDKDPFSLIRNAEFDIIYVDAGELPLYVLVKDPQEFTGIFTFYETIVKIATGELKSAFDFHTVNARVAYLSDRLHSSSKDQVLQVIESMDGVRGLVQLYAQFVGANVGQIMSDQELGEAKSVTLVRDKLRSFTDELNKLTTLLKSAEENKEIMSKDEIISDILSSLTGSSESVILKRCELVGKFNDLFQGLLDDYPRDFESSGNGGIREQIVSDLDRFIDNVKQSDDYNPTERNTVINAVNELKAIYEMVQIQILGSIFKFRMNTDKINRFQDACIDSFLDICDQGEKVIHVMEKSEDF